MPATPEMPRGAANAASGLLKNRELYGQFNSLRYRRVNTVFPENCQLIFKMVPFLLHTNFRGLPGYVDHPQTPCKIKNYQPDDDTAILVNRYFSKKCKFNPRTDMNEGFIEFLSVMGSVGSIAQTAKSDFDMWVGIHRKDVDQEEYRRFLEKLRGIEEWLMKLRLEVHFFPTDIVSVTKNLFGSVDDESCGSAQALMLKDEFYRTAILIAGKTPYWWVVEPGVSDEEYVMRYQRYSDSDPSFKEQYVDIGNVSKIEKAEFFGAALWQLVKSLQSPFKSFIKMCLIENYLYSNTDDKVSLLSNTLKENVILKGNLDPQAIDAYLLMFKTVDDFFLRSDKRKEAEMLRTCFYMKIQPNISGKNKHVRSESDKHSLISRYVQEWKWDSERLQRLDMFYCWSMADLLKFDQELKIYMVQSFQALTKSRDLLGGQSLISEDDLKIISRKLLSYYLPKPKKIKRFVFSFDDNVYEPELSVVKQEDGWRLYRGEVKREQHRVQFSNLLYGGEHLTDVCLWIAYSKIFGQTGTKLNVFSGESNLSQSDVSQMIAALSDTVTGHVQVKPRNYLEEPFIQNVFVTCRFDPADGKDTVSCFYVNSWKELFAEHFASEAEFDALLCEILSGYIRLGMQSPIGMIHFHSASGGMKELLEFKKRVMNILTAFKNDFQPKKNVGVYAGKCAGGYIGFAATGAQVHYFKHETLAGLTEMVSRQIQSDLPRKYFFAEEIDPAEIQGLADSRGHSLTL